MNPPSKFLAESVFRAHISLRHAATCVYSDPLPDGPGLYGHEGCITCEAPDGRGVIVIDSVEMNEDMYPIVFESRRLATDTLGAPRWNSAPATEASYQSLSRDMTVAYCADCGTHPAN